MHAGGGRRARGEGLRPAAPGPRLSRREICVLAAALRLGPALGPGPVCPSSAGHGPRWAPGARATGSAPHCACPQLPRPRPVRQKSRPRRRREAQGGEHRPGDSHSHSPQAGDHVYCVHASRRGATAHPGWLALAQQRGPSARHAPALSRPDARLPVSAVPSLGPSSGAGPRAVLLSTALLPLGGCRGSVSGRGLAQCPGYSNTAAAPIPVPMHMDTTP